MMKKSHERALGLLLAAFIQGDGWTTARHQSIQRRTCDELTALGYVERNDGMFTINLRLAKAGAAAINRADLFAQPATAAAQDAGGGTRWSDAELSAYDPDEPFPPARPGQMIFPAEQEQYEYEIAALKKLLSDTVIERDTGNVERLRLRAALLEIENLPEDNFKIAWSIAVAALADEPVAQGDGAE